VKPKAQPRRPQGSVKFSPQLERRRALRREKQRELLIQLWRVTALLLTSAGLGWLLLRFGWTLEGTNQVVIRGDTRIRAELVAKVGGLNFPQPLFEINPADVETRLLKDLPVRTASVERRLFPARLNVELLGQMPIAYATRQRANKTEQGMVDDQANWISPSNATPKKTPKTKITIVGWTEDRRKLIAEMLQNRSRLGTSLQEIIIHPDGAITLKTSNLGLIDLGNDVNQLPRQIAAILQLSRNMPQHLIGKGSTTLDLSNPDRPELELPLKPPSSAPAK